MRAVKLLSVSALAVNKAAIDKAATGRQEIEKPLYKDEPVFGRRKALKSLFGAAVVAVPAAGARALDMDAFMNAELDSDQKNCDPKKDAKCAPKLTADEALCQYGSGGKAKGEACKRVKAAGGALPTTTKTKSLGGAYAI